MIGERYNGNRFEDEVTEMELNEIKHELNNTAKRLADIRGSL
jgi:uncharacterized protein (UPF0128 family)